MDPLLKHQSASIEFGRGKPAVFDTSDPGTGKTRVAIELFKPRIALSKKAVLVLGPKSSLRSTWANDLRKFAPELTWSIAYAANRQRAFDTPADFYITNHDAAVWLAKQPKSFFRRFVGLIIDESGAYKHHTSRRSKSVARIRGFFEFCHSLNGTPNPNTILDIWHQMYVLDRGVRLGRSFFHFRNQVCEPRQVGPQPNMVRWTDRPGAEQAVASLLRDVVIRNKVEDCVDLPDNHEYTVPYTLEPEAYKRYLQMKHVGLAQLETGMINAVNGGAVATKLAQIASGAVYEDEFKYHVVDTGRYELIMDLLDARKHSLVFFLWKHQKDQLLAAAEKRGFTYCVIDGEVPQREREENIRLFEAGFYKACFLHPASAAHSLTLVRAKTAIWASPTYNTEHHVQGNKRIDRIGQTEKTETIVVVAEGTIDEKIYAAMGDKRDRLEILLEELKT